jgi:thiol-disulfide isomerase/thioredoxin
MFIGLAMPAKPLLLAERCLACRATALFMLSCLAHPIISWANPRIQPELILSIDARGIEQSGISRCLEEKYPHLREWVEGMEEVQAQYELYEAMGLEEKDFTQFSLVMSGLEKLVDNNQSSDLSLSDLFISIDLMADRPMKLSGFIDWVETQLTEEFGPDAATKWIKGKSVNPISLNFSIPLAELNELNPNDESKINLDGNLSFSASLEGNLTQIKCFLSGKEFPEPQEGLYDLNQIALLEQLAEDRQFSFYCRLPERSKAFAGGAISSPLEQAFAGIRELGIGASFREESILLECALDCSDETSASALHNLWEGSLGFAKLALMEDPSSRGVIKLLNQIQSGIEENRFNLSLEMNATQLEEIISEQLTMLAPKPPLQMYPRGPQSLRGQPAPEVHLELLDGGKFSLSAHKGKVVVLDFWATWCRPCRTALPILEAVQKKYAYSELCLLTINQGESDNEVSAFLEDYDLRDLVVAMDPDAKAGKQYQVQGLPHTVIIGPSGKVEKVWVGFSPFLENDLVAEIDRLLLK